MHKKLRSKRIRSIANTAENIKDALAQATAKGIVLAGKEKRRIEQAIAQRAFMASPAAKVYYGSNGGNTRSFCSQLEKQGPLGRIAAALFRAQKASDRAAAYRGSVNMGSSFGKSYRDRAYDRKDEALSNLAMLLADTAHGLSWGWNRDMARNILCLDLPHGQVSFHSVQRHRGPDYQGEWDGERKGEQRILEFCNSLVEESVVNNIES